MAETFAAKFILRLVVGSFRKLNQVEIDFSNTVEAIIGANNSGKTSILMAIKLVFYILQIWAGKNGNDTVSIDPMYVVKAVGVNPKVLFKHKVTFEVTLADPSKSIVFITIFYEKSESIARISCSHREEACSFVNSFAMCYLHSVHPPEYVEQSSHVFPAIPWYDMRSLAVNIRNVFKGLEGKAVVLQDLQFFMPEISDLKIHQSAFELYLRVVRNNHGEEQKDLDELLDIANFGAGQMNLFYLIVALQHARETTQRKLVCVLDEPTAFLNGKLVERFIEYIESKGAQFIIATHSYALIKALKNSQIFVCESGLTGNMYTKMEDSVKLFETQMDKIESIKFFNNRNILIVENEPDYMFICHWIKKFCKTQSYYEFKDKIAMHYTSKRLSFENLQKVVSSFINSAETDAISNGEAKYCNVFIVYDRDYDMQLLLDCDKTSLLSSTQKKPFIKQDLYFWNYCERENYLLHLDLEQTGSISKQKEIFEAEISIARNRLVKQYFDNAQLLQSKFSKPVNEVLEIADEFWSENIVNNNAYYKVIDAKEQIRNDDIINECKNIPKDITSEMVNLIHRLFYFFGLDAPQWQSDEYPLLISSNSTITSSAENSQHILQPQQSKKEKKEAREIDLLRKKLACVKKLFSTVENLNEMKSKLNSVLGEHISIQELHNMLDEHP